MQKKYCGGEYRLFGSYTIAQFCEYWEFAEKDRKKSEYWRTKVMLCDHGIIKPYLMVVLLYL